MELNVSELLLDTENPRIGGSDSQRTAINALIAEGSGQLLALAEDIVTRETLNPAESPIAVTEDGKHVLIEGNRRLACLKLLQNPDLADDPKVAAQFRGLAKTGTGPQTVEVWLAPSREEANHWIRLRHTGENGGVGVRTWSTEQQQRFSRRSSTQAGRAVTFADSVAVAFFSDDELLELLREVRGRSLTTLGRVVSDPEVRRAFGFDIQGDRLEFLHDRAASRAALLRLLRDIAGHPVSKFMSKGDRRDYVQEAKESLPGAGSLLPAPATPEDLSIQDGAAHVSSESPVSAFTGEDVSESRLPAEAPDPGKLAGRAPSTRDERVIYQSVRLRHVAVRTRNTLKEAQRLQINDAPHVCAVMLRVVLELVLTEAGERMGWFGEGEKLPMKVVKSVRKLDPDYQSPRANPALKNAYTASAKEQGGVGIIDLNSAVHAFNKVASTSDVRARSADFAPLLVAIDELLGENP